MLSVLICWLCINGTCPLYPSLHFNIAVISWELEHKLDNGSHLALLSTVLGFLGKMITTNWGQPVSSHTDPSPSFSFAKVQTWAICSHSVHNCLCWLLWNVRALALVVKGSAGETQTSDSERTVIPLRIPEETQATLKPWRLCVFRSWHCLRASLQGLSSSRAVPSTSCWLRRQLPTTRSLFEVEFHLCFDEWIYLNEQNTVSPTEDKVSR